MHTPQEHGANISEVIELTLAALERVAPTTRALDLCAIAEAIIEGAGGAGDWRQDDWRIVYAAAEAGSLRYREAVLAVADERKLEVAA